MNVSLTPELESFVNTKVDSGLYHSVSEVIREGLRLLRERELNNLSKRLSHEIDLGLLSLDQGKRSPGTKVYQRLRKRSRNYQKAKK